MQEEAILVVTLLGLELEEEKGEKRSVRGSKKEKRKKETTRLTYSPQTINQTPASNSISLGSFTGA